MLFPATLEDSRTQSNPNKGNVEKFQMWEQHVNLAVNHCN